MFADAYAIAQNFTRPFVISTRKYNEDCNSGIGTYVIINEEGWFVTAFHIINQIMQLNEEIQKYHKAESDLDVIRKDTTKTENQKRSILGKMVISANAITNYSVWLGIPNTGIDATVHVIPEIDLAIGKIIGFDKNSISVYPEFKDPAKPMRCGTSLCKLGFPLHNIKPTFDKASGRFNLPEGAVPLPLFPLEGIFTRIVRLRNPDAKIPYPLQYIETSSPGLLGQSGGPTFDKNGTIWAIQSQTQHHKLGFGNNVSGIKDKEKEHLQNQWLNVGWGIHSETIVNFFRQFNISFKLSSY